MKKESSSVQVTAEVERLPFSTDRDRIRAYFMTMKFIQAERRLVRALVRKNTEQHQKVLAIFRKSKDPRDKVLEERVLGGIEALGDLLAALKEGR